MLEILLTASNIICNASFCLCIASNCLQIVFILLAVYLQLILQVQGESKKCNSNKGTIRSWIIFKKLKSRYRFYINRRNLKIKSISVLLNFLHYFYHGIQCAKTHNSVHGKACEVQHEICWFKAWSLKDTQNLLWLFNLHQIFAVCHQSYVFDDSVNVCKLLNW